MTDRERQYLAALERLRDAVMEKSQVDAAEEPAEALAWFTAVRSLVNAVMAATALIEQARKE